MSDLPRVLERPIGRAQQRFINDVYAHALQLAEAGKWTTVEDVRRNVAPHLSLSTIRSWLLHMYELGWLDRQRAGRRYGYRPRNENQEE